MGTHSKKPSIVTNMDSPINLSDLLKSNPELVGQNIIERFGAATLPYLFKVLSINKALSIQVHPDKKHAEELHRTKPDIYQDANHKPEIAIGEFYYLRVMIFFFAEEEFSGSQ